MTRPTLRRNGAGFALFALLWLAQPAQAFDACAPDAAANYTAVSQRATQGLLWKVISCGRAPSYVFGTMHSDEPAAWKQARKVQGLLPQLAGAGFEYLQPADADVQMQRAMFDPLGNQPLQAQLTPREWKKLHHEMVETRGMPEQNLQRMRPWAVAVMLQMPTESNHSQSESGLVVDDRLKKLAAEHGVALFGLETLREQLGVFDTMPDSQQVAMLKATLGKLDDIATTNEALLRAYARGDAAEIARLGEKGFNDIDDSELRDYLREALLLRRNRLMAERAQPYLQKGNQLVAVGALHLSGQQGLLSLLEKQGYFFFPAE